jgi:hypothetical protein
MGYLFQFLCVDFTNSAYFERSQLWPLVLDYGLKKMSIIYQMLQIKGLQTIKLFLSDKTTN